MGLDPVPGSIWARVWTRGEHQPDRFRVDDQAAGLAHQRQEPRRAAGARAHGSRPSADASAHRRATEDGPLARCGRGIRHRLAGWSEQTPPRPEPRGCSCPPGTPPRPGAGPPRETRAPWPPCPRHRQGRARGLERRHQGGQVLRQLRDRLDPGPRIVGDTHDPRVVGIRHRTGPRRHGRVVLEYPPRPRAPAPRTRAPPGPQRVDRRR